MDFILITEILVAGVIFFLEEMKKVVLIVKELLKVKIDCDIRGLVH